MPGESELRRMIEEAAYYRAEKRGFTPRGRPVRGLLIPKITGKEQTMADDLKQTGKPDDQRINVEQDHELSYWSEKLGVSREQLREAVAKAGSRVKDVQRQLGR